MEVQLPLLLELFNVAAGITLHQILEVEQVGGLFLHRERVGLLGGETES